MVYASVLEFVETIALRTGRTKQRAASFPRRRRNLFGEGRFGGIEFGATGLQTVAQTVQRGPVDS